MLLKLLIEISILAISICIVIDKKERPLMWFVGGIFLINSNVSFMGVHLVYLLSIALLLSVFLRKDGVIVLSTFPLIQVFILYITCIFFLGLVGPNLKLLDRVIFPTKKILSTVITLPLIFYYGKKDNAFENFVTICYKIWIFVFLYGLFEFIFSWNPINNTISAIFNGSEVDLFAKKSIHYGRFLGLSVYDMSFNFGFVSSLFCLFFLYLYSSLKKMKFLIASFLGVLGCFLCGSRTAIFSCIISVTYFIFYVFPLRRIFKLLIVSLPLIILLLIKIPLFADLVSATIDGISGGKEYVGSSLEMRVTQYKAAVSLFREAPIFGNGLYYFVDVLGWDALNRQYEGIFVEIQGLESYFFNLILEQGIFGVLIALVFFISIIYYFSKKKIVNYKLSYLGISLVLLFIIFTLLTGELGAWWYTMPFLGMIISKITNIK